METTQQHQHHDTGRTRLVYATDDGRQVSVYGVTYREAFDRLVAGVKVVTVRNVREVSLDDEEVHLQDWRVTS